MKKLIAITFMLMAAFVQADYLGSFEVGDTIPISIVMHDFDTGAAADPTGSPTLKIYEDGNDTELTLTAGEEAMEKFDSLTGHYLQNVVIISGNGFEPAKHYTVVITATVDTVAAITVHTFQTGLDVGTILGETPVDLNNDTISDIAADTVPPATPTVMELYAYLYYELIYCKTDLTRSTGVMIIENAAGADAYQRTFSDSGTVTSRAEVVEIP